MCNDYHCTWTLFKEMWSNWRSISSLNPNICSETTSQSTSQSCKLILFKVFLRLHWRMASKKKLNISSSKELSHFSKLIDSIWYGNVLSNSTPSIKFKILQLWNIIWLSLWNVSIILINSLFCYNKSA